MDRADIQARSSSLLQPGHVRIDDRRIAFEREDQRHVHADPGTDRGGDGRQSFNRRGNLDQEVGPVHPRPQPLGQVDGGSGVACQSRVDLDRDTSIHAAGEVVHRPQHVAGIPDVGGGEFENGLVQRDAIGAQLGHLIGVGLTVGERAGEDRRIRGDADDAVVLHQVGEIAAFYAFAGQIVQPDGDAGLGQFGQSFSHSLSS